jgi:quercetin 2,3-dioxygenase
MKEIKKIIKGRAAIDGAGVKLVRVFGYHDVIHFDPFLLLDAFDSSDSRDYIKGFPWHPHRGIETITYLVEGKIEHGDSLGNRGVINDGDCQWMTGGSGIIHQEMPQQSKRLFGVQLWLNLPKENKMTNPQYRDITQQVIPVIKKPYGTLRIISGKFDHQEGSLQGDYVKPQFYDIDMLPNNECKFDSSLEETTFVYILSGQVSFGSENEIMLSEKQVVLFGKGDTFVAKSGSTGARILYLSAKPLHEPISWGGPIVMNTKEELNQAFYELDHGTFIKR